MKNLKKNLVVLSLLVASTSFSATDYKALKHDYIEQYRTTAIQQMIHTKIPASITLAQGLLESGAGTSRLATKGNNHFGIKCHGWQGDYMFHDDDAKGECFRVYGNAELSFVDHSDFLTNRNRYSFLFGLTTTDYVGWAKGLKKAGYATNPQYANILIKLIQDYDLDDYDAAIVPMKNNALTQKPRNKFSQVDSDLSKKGKIVYTKTDTKEVHNRNSKAFSKALVELKNYKEFENANEDAANKVALKKELVVIAQENQTLISISEDLGIKLKKLEKRNPDLKIDQALDKGVKVYLD